VQGRAWREEIPQTSFVSLAFPLSPSCEAVRTSVVDRVISGVERVGVVGFLICGGEWERRSNPGGGVFLVLVGEGSVVGLRAATSFGCVAQQITSVSGVIGFPVEADKCAGAVPNEAVNVDIGEDRAATGARAREASKDDAEVNIGEV
jgi:hypothetical protein